MIPNSNSISSCTLLIASLSSYGPHLPIKQYKVLHKLFDITKSTTHLTH